MDPAHLMRVERGEAGLSIESLQRLGARPRSRRAREDARPVRER